jgi:hypothetical protein
VELVRGACAIDAPKTGLRVERADPPAELIRQVEATVQAAGIDVGGIEYLVDDRDGKAYLYDVNALSNFVADAVNVVGFDPFVRLVDYLEARLATGDGRRAEDGSEFVSRHASLAEEDALLVTEDGGAVVR